MSEDGKNLVGWFGKRKEDVVQNVIAIHAPTVIDCMLKSNLCFRNMKNGNTVSADKCIGRIECTAEMDCKSLIPIEALGSLEMAADTGKPCADIINVVTVSRRM